MVRANYSPKHDNSAAGDLEIGRLLDQIEELAAWSGDNLLRRLTRQLATVTGARWALVSELKDASHVTAVAFWTGDGYSDQFEYDLAGTPCEHLFASDSVFIAGGLAEKFPHAEWLNSLPAESLAAIPLFKADSSPLGHLSVVHDRPLSGEASVLAALRLFGLRAAAELERSGVEKRLKESEERYRRLVEASPDIIYRYSFPNHRMEYVNPAIERISGHTATDFYNDPDLLLKMVAEPEGDEEDTFSGRVFHPSKIRRWKRADGTEFWTEARNIQVYDETGRLIAQEGVSRDVTKSVLAEQELAEQLQLLSVVVEAIPDRIFRLSEDGALHSLIDDDGRLPGNGASTLEELIPAESLAEVRGAIREALRRSGVQAVRYQVELDDHMESVYELRMAPTREGDLIAMLRDITGSSWMMAEEEHRQTREILEQKVEHGAAARNPYSFTFRELTVLHLLVNGEPDKQIARQLGISPYTVNRHVSNILMKMGASSRTEAGVRAVREKLLA